MIQVELKNNQKYEVNSVSENYTPAGGESAARHTLNIDLGGKAARNLDMETLIASFTEENISLVNVYDDGELAASFSGYTTPCFAKTIGSQGLTFRVMAAK